MTEKDATALGRRAAGVAERERIMHPDTGLTGQLSH